MIITNRNWLKYNSWEKLDIHIELSDIILKDDFKIILYVFGRTAKILKM